MHEVAGTGIVVREPEWSDTDARFWMLVKLDYFQAPRPHIEEFGLARLNEGTYWSTDDPVVASELADWLREIQQ